MDGCLIDSAEVQKAAFFGSYAAVVGDDKCPTYKEYLKYTGDSVDNVFKKMGLPLEMAPIYRQISANSIDKVSVYWDIIKVIHDLRQYGCKIGICTGKDHYRAEAILNYYHIDSYFDIIVGADDIDEPKPSPLPVLYAIKKLNIDKNDTILIGDGYNDILCAKNASIRSILTLWYGDNGVPREADYTVHTAVELKTMLFELL